MTRKKRNLTNEEQALWNQVAQKITPLKPEQKGVTQDSPSMGQPSAHPSLVKTPSFSLPSQEPSSIKNLSASSSSTRHIRRVRNVKIEARLDLHGLTRHQAHAQLTRFLLSCQGRRRLWVLVITGKGRRNSDTEELHETRSQGTLRVLVPQWLEEPALRSVVSAYTTAKPQDGGSGALYIRLKQLADQDMISSARGGP